MIIDKQPLPDDPTPTDAPPSYDTLSAGPSSQDNKYNLVHLSPSTSSYPPNSPPPVPPKSPASPASPSTNAKGKARAVNWFAFATEARTRSEVRNTVLGLVKDLIQEHITNSEAATGILQSCAEACATHSLSLSSILQEKSIENHTPLYWAIVKRPPDEHQEKEDMQCPDLLTALISYATPLNQATVAEVRLACLATSDQALFQRLRLSPEFAPVSGADQMLLGGTIPPEEVELEDIPGEGGGSFAVNFVIPHFHKRMVVSKQIAIEFIARSRMWRLAFFIAPEPRRYRTSVEPRVGSWCISLSLIETSPPTYVQARLLIPEAKSPSANLEAPESPGSSTNDPPSSSPFFRLPKSLSYSEPNSKNAISILLKSNEQIEAATGSRRNSAGKSIVVSLEESTMGANLQYGNNPYIGPDEKLRGRLEARLGKSEADCIIC
ncbi:hypothetical protein CVT25_007454 [Psilocybe cyanescens]|uniref:Uncharacterized protein n=1 Tax=Psilocybe cyanescens TaxID=93625 RepID=A0A409XVP1_PSICY|nr:hypothetical protein CVT25_007454 [Psilocybe cyanescens]